MGSVADILMSLAMEGGKRWLSYGKRKKYDTCVYRGGGRNEKVSGCCTLALPLGLLVLYHDRDQDGWMDDGKHL